MSTVVVDYGRGNLFSLSQALRVLGASHEISSDPTRIAAAERVVLPGVGAFGDGMAALTDAGLVAPLREIARRGTPMLGICLGMQLLAGRGLEFGDHLGLGIIPGIVERLPDLPGDDAMRIPNVGWREISPMSGGTDLFATLPPKPMMYFVHSYAMAPTDPACIAATIPFNGRDVCVSVRVGNVVGYQFHPEKSGAQGLELIRNFLSMTA
ncbi:imidazole glycerol phosphate synthase subunit HisH [Phaeospirillum tilakii]|uniref:Imidazole glycerol phosphate synthase subunit HisH n=1 Tax=Phaeospirillum tilakii TaxID=741673 RepID=A0ABW5CHL0_9PROT